MLDLFGSVKKLTKLDEVNIDNFVFRLHYKATFILLVSCSILVTAKQYFGDPINCIVDEGIPQKVMDTYCWIESTFTLPDLMHAVVGVQVPHPGVGGATDESEVKYHKYYQWVCFFLFGQGERENPTNVFCSIETRNSTPHTRESFATPHTVLMTPLFCFQPYASMRRATCGRLGSAIA
jgi:hypothetical protein